MDLKYVPTLKSNRADQVNNIIGFMLNTKF